MLVSAGVDACMYFMDPPPLHPPTNHLPAVVAQVTIEGSTVSSKLSKDLIAVSKPQVRSPMRRQRNFTSWISSCDKSFLKVAYCNTK